MAAHGRTPAELSLYQASFSPSFTFPAYFEGKGPEPFLHLHGDLFEIILQTGKHYPDFKETPNDPCSLSLLPTPKFFEDPPTEERGALKGEKVASNINQQRRL